MRPVRALEAGLRAAHGTPAFTAARVLRLGNRLFVLAGDLTATVTLGPAGDDPAADELGFRAGGPAWGALSADLPGFGGVSRNNSRLRVSIGSADPHTVTINGRPNTLDAARTALEAGLRAAGTTPVFTQARVAPLDNRLLVVPGPGIHYNLTGILPGEYLVRIQVDGAESLLEADAAGRYVKPKVTVP